MDKISPEKRSWVMSRVRSKNTTPELLVRKELYRMGYRYRLHNNSLPGTPDIAMRKLSLAIFINGCFWHGHETCKKGRLPKSRVEFWGNKIRNNQRRDKKNISQLKKMGWKVVTIWECQIPKDKAILQQFLKKIMEKVLSSEKKK